MPPEIIEEPKLTHFDVLDVSFKATPGQWGNPAQQKPATKRIKKLGAMLGLGAGGYLNNTAFQAKSIAEFLKTNPAIFFLRCRNVRDIVIAALGKYP